jgi:hypothetical protein
VSECGSAWQKTSETLTASEVLFYILTGAVQRGSTTTLPSLRHSPEYRLKQCNCKEVAILPKRKEPKNLIDYLHSPSLQPVSLKKVIAPGHAQRLNSFCERRLYSGNDIYLNGEWISRRVL